MNRIATPFLIILLSIIVNSFAFGETYYSQGSVAANSTGNWNTIPGGGGTSPSVFTSGDIFIIQNTHSMTSSGIWTVTGAGAAIQINSGGTLTVNSNVTSEILTVYSGGLLNVNSASVLQINNGDGGGFDLTVNGTMNYNGVLSYSGGATGEIQTAGVFIHQLNGLTIPSFTWTGNARITVTGVTSATTISGLNQAFREFRWNCTGQTSDVQFNSQLTAINKLFWIQSTGSGSIVLFNSTANLNATYFDLTGGTVDFTTIGNIFPSITINSSGTAFTQLNGSTIKTSGGASKGLFKIGNNVNNISQGGTIGPGAVGFHLLPGSFVDPSDSDIDVTGAFIIDSGAYYGNNNYSNNFKIVGTGNFELRKGGHFYITDPSGITNSPTLSGSVQVTGTRKFDKEANYYYWGNAPMTMGSASPDTFKAYVELWPNTSLTFSKGHVVTGTMAVMEVPMDLNGYDLEINGALIDSIGSIGYYPRFTGSGNFVLNSGAKITIKNEDGITASGSTGFVQVLGSRSFSAGANYRFQGYGAQSMGTALPASVNDLFVFNGAGTTLLSSLTVNGKFSLYNGGLFIGDNDLTLNSEVDSTSTGYINTNNSTSVVYNQSSSGQWIVTNNSQYGNLSFSNYPKNVPSGTMYISNAFTPGSADHVVNDANDININGTGTQNIPGFRYAELNISKSAGDAVFPNSSIDTVHISGTFTSGPFPTYTTTGSTVEFNSSTVSQYTGYLDYHNLVLRNTYAKVAIGASITVNGLLDVGGQGLYLGATNTDNASEVVVRAGATLELGHANAILTVNDGNGGDDLIVDGVIENSGSLIYGSGATGLMNGTYREYHDGGTIPAFTWGNNSTVEILGIVSATTLGGLNQTFFNFYYYSTGQTSTMNFNSQLTNVAGTFDIQNTGTGSIVLFNTNTKLTVGKYNGYDGIVNLSTTEEAQDTIEITGSNSPNEFANPFGSLTITGGSGAHGVIHFIGEDQTASVSGSISSDIEFLVSKKLTFPSMTTIDGPFIVENGGALNKSTLVGSGSFELKSGGTIVIDDADGITESGATGNIRMSGSRTFSAGGRYIYENTVLQNTGDGLPPVVSVLSQKNSSGVSLTRSVTVADTLFFDDQTGTLNINTDTLSIDGAAVGYVENLNTGSGTVIYSSTADGQGVIPTTYFNLLFSDHSKNLNAGTYTVTNMFAPGTVTDHMIASNSTFVFDDASSLSVPPLRYGNLTINGNRDVNFVTFSNTDSTYISGVITLNATFSGGGYQTAGSKIVFNGTGAQSIPDLDFSSLIIDKSDGNASASANITVTDNLALLYGTFNDNGSIVTVNGNIQGSLGQHISTSEGGKILLTGGSASHGISDVDLADVELDDATYGAVTTSAPGIKHLILTNGTLDVTSGLYILNNGSLSKTGGDITGSGFVNFNGTGEVTGSFNFYNVYLQGAVTFASGSSVENILRIQNGGSVAGNALTYGTGSVLNYNSGGTFARVLEWSSSSGPGYPYNVEIQNNTTLDLGANGGTATLREIENNLTIVNGSTLTMNGSGNEMTAALIVRGSISNSGTLELSGQPGGYLQLYGDLTQTGTLTANLSAVRMTGTAPQHITMTGGGNIALDSLVIASADSVVLVDATTLSVNNAFVQESGIFNLGTSSLDIMSGSTLTANGGVFVNAGHTVNFTGGGSISGSLVLGTVTTSGALDPGSDLTITDQLIINNLGSIVNNAPYYDPGSTLVYNYNSVFDRDIEWSATSGPGYPYNVTVQNNTYLRLGAGEMTTYREMAGDLTIASGSTLNMNDTESGMTASLGVLGDITINGELTLSSDPGGDLTVGGDLSNSGDFIVYARKVTFNGAAAQSITGVLEFADLEINNTVSNVTMNDSLLVNGSLTMQNGHLVTGTDTLTIGPSGNVINYGTSYVIGNMRKPIPAGSPTVSFEIGDASRYAQVNILFASVSSSGFVTVSTSTSGPSLTGSLIDPNKNLDRFWTITNNGTDFFQSVATFTFDNTEVDGGANTTNFDGKRWDGVQWNDQTPTGWSSGSTDVNFLTNFGTFALGENISHNITATSYGGGSTTPSGITGVIEGNNQGYSISPDPGYHIDSVVVDGTNLGAITSHDFNSVSAAHTLDAYFSINSYSITVNTFGNGTVSPGSGSVNYGSNNTYSINPDPGYHIDSVLVDGSNYGAITSHDFNSVSATHSLDAYFSINSYAITVNTFGNGTVSPGSGSVNYGSNNTYSINPDPGYHIDSVLVDGSNLGAITSHDFNSVSAAHSIDAYFSINSYAITVNTFGNGTVSPGSGSVNYGSNNTYSINPDPGYHIDSVLVDGSNLGAITSHDFNSVTATHTLDAYFSIDTYSITVNTYGTGSVTPGSGLVNYGSNNTYSITPDPGYHIDSVLVDGSNLGAITSHDFNSVAATHTLDAYFSIDSYSITVNSYGNGTVSPGSTTANYGSNNPFTVNPDPGYHVDSVLVDGVNIGAVLSVDLNSISSAHTIHAYFSIDTYSITINASAGGSVTPGSSTVNYGSNNSYTITPDPGYHIDSVVVDGTNIGIAASYDFNIVSEAHTLNAYFSINTYSITVNTFGNGGISPGTGSANYGTQNTFTVTPDPGYHIDSVLVDGIRSDSLGSYTFFSVSASHTIDAYFSLSYAVTFSVDMRPAIFGGRFVRSTDSILVRGSIPPLSWFGTAHVLTDGNNDSIYTITEDLHRIDTLEYKYVIRHKGLDFWERETPLNQNRIIVLTGPETRPTESFDNLPVYSPMFGAYSKDANTDILLHMDENPSVGPTNYSALGFPVFDYSNNGNHAYASFMGSIAGRFGEAKRFTSTSDSMSIEYTSALEPGSDFTFEAWVKFDTLNQNYHTIFAKGANADDYGIVAFLNGDSKYYFILRGKNSSAAIVNVAGTTPLEDSTWYHVAGAVHNDSLKLFVNGVLDYALPFSTPVPAASNKLFIGANPFAGIIDRFSGAMDEVRISNTFRTPETFGLQLPPKVLTAAATGTTIDLNWSNGGGAVPASRYRIYRGFDSTNVAPIAESYSPGFSDLLPNGPSIYYYRTATIDSTGFEGRKSFAVSDTVFDLIAPAVPQNLIASAAEGQATIHWNPNSEGDFSKYIIYRGTLPNPTTAIDSTTDINDTLKVYTGLTNYQQYYFRVAAKDVNGNTGAYSNETTAMPVDQTPPATPVSLAATPADGSIGLTWSANSESDFAKYYIYGGTVPNPGAKIDSVSVIGNSFRTIVSLTNYTTYYYRITAADTSGNESGFSNEVSVIPIDLNPPSVPVNMTAVAGNGSIELKWGSVPESDFLKYYIYRDVTANPTSIVDSTTDASDTLRIFSGLTNGTLYYMKVAAKDSNGNISMSNELRTVPVIEAGNALQFNGTDGYVQTPILSLTGDFTLEAWVKPNTPTDYRPIVSKNTINAFGNEYAEFNLQVQNNGNLNFFMGNGSSYAMGLNGGILTPGQWYHVAVTISGSTGRMYLNGEETGTNTFSGSRIYNNLPLEIGKYNNGSIQFFDGGMDEVRIWNVARTQAQIKNSMVKNLRGDTPNLVGLYHMDEPVSTPNTYDASSNNNTAVLQNGVSFVAGTGAMAPFAPGSLTANASDGQVQIKWTPNSESDFGKYYIYRGTTANPTTIVDSTASIADTAKTYSGLTNYTDYYFRVASADQNGILSPYSNEIAAMPVDLTAPAAPATPLATAGDGSVDLSWTAAVESDFAKYYVYGGVSPNPSTRIDSIFSVNATMQTYSGLTNYTTNYYRITAVDTSGNESSRSTEVSATPVDTTTPDVPQNLSAVAGDNQITLRWNSIAGTDLGKYYIYGGSSPNPTALYDSTMDVQDTVKVFSGMMNYVEQYFRIAAADSNGNISGYSNEVSATPKDMTAPSAPLSLTVIDSMASYFTIVWNMNMEPDIAKYYIYRDTLPNPVTLIDSTVNSVDTVRAFTTLTIGQPYYFRVAAVDTSFNISPLSNTASAVPFMVYGISSYANGSGTVSPSGTTYVDHGDSLQFTIHADPLHHIDSISIDAPIILIDAVTAKDTRMKKVSIDVQPKIISSDPITIFGTGHDDTLRTYTFQNVTDGHTIRAYFAKNSFLIDAQVIGNGSITPDGNVPVYQSDTALFTITPDLYHHLDSVIVDGIKVDSICTYTFENVTAAHTIAAYFSPNELHHFVITNSDYMTVGSQTAGQTFTIITTAVDSLGNPVNTFTGNVWFSSTDTTIAVLGGDYSIPFTAGQHGPQIVTLYRGGMNTITVIDSGSGKSGTSVPFLVNGAGLHHFSVKDTSGSGIPDQIENHPFPVMITAEDMFNNTQTDFNGTVEVTVTGAVLTQGEGVTSSFTGGILTPHIMQIENSALYVISVSDPISEKSGSSGLFTVVPDTNIIFTASANGTISPLGAHPAAYGDTVIITFAPLSGFHFDSLYVDGVRVLDSVSQYTFFDVTATHSIDVYNSVDLNIPPVFTMVMPDTAIARFDTLSFTYMGLDPDLGLLRFSLFSAPSGAEIDSVTGELKYIPAANANGQFTFIVKVNDDSLAAAFDTVNVRVNIYGDVSGNGTISAFDGAMVLQNVVSAITFTPLQEKVADVSGVGGISSLDASFILQHAVGLISTFPGGLGKTTKVDAVLSAFSFRIQPNGKPDEYDLYVSVNKTSNVFGIAMSLGFDTSIVRPLMISKSASTDSMSMAYRFPDGSANLALAGITPLTSAGDIIKFTFRLKDPNYPKNAVLFTMKKFVLNETDYTNDIGGITLNVRNLAQLPTVYKLEQNFPNPFNPSTTINYQLPEAGSVRIVVYNMLGQMVKTLVNEEQPAGFYSMTWNGRDESNGTISSGVYFYRIEALGPNNKRFTEVKKMIMMK